MEEKHMHHEKANGSLRDYLVIAILLAMLTISIFQFFELGTIKNQMQSASLSASFTTQGGSPGGAKQIQAPPQSSGSGMVGGC